MTKEKLKTFLKENKLKIANCFVVIVGILVIGEVTKVSFGLGELSRTKLLGYILNEGQENGFIKFFDENGNEINDLSFMK